MVDKFTDDLTQTLQFMHNQLSPHKEAGLLMPMKAVEGYLALLDTSIKLAKSQHQELYTHRLMAMEQASGVKRAGGMQ